MSAFFTNKHIDFRIGFFMIADNVIHFSNCPYPPAEMFLFDTVVKVKFKKVLWLDFEIKIQDFSTLTTLRHLHFDSFEFISVYMMIDLRKF